MLTQSQIATLRNVNERPGKLSIYTIGVDYAANLEAAGFVTIKGSKVFPTPASASYVGRSAERLRDADEDARAALLGRWGAAA